jgi:uncharacterized surface protein with fasciclin (FAS1) repeats
MKKNMFKTNQSLNGMLRQAITVSLFAAIILGAGFSSFASENSGDHHNKSAKADIVDTAVAAGKFSILAKALEAAGLIDALKGEGPFTVFAPTDDAFAKLPAGTIEMLLRPENKEKLKSILLYHVVSGKVLATDVVKLNGKMVPTLEGSRISVCTANGVRVDDSNVTKTDILASNGVIHVIDTVLMP